MTPVVHRPTGCRRRRPDLPPAPPPEPVSELRRRTEARLSSGRIIWPEHHRLSADSLVGLTLLVAVGVCQWTQLVFPAWVLLLSLVILFDCPLSRDSHPRMGSSARTGPA
jgi:hypothetical protein